jgi:hypothetical protein
MCIVLWYVTYKLKPIAKVKIRKILVGGVVWLARTGSSEARIQAVLAIGGGAYHLVQAPVLRCSCLLALRCARFYYESVNTVWCRARRHGRGYGAGNGFRANGKP